MFRRLLREDGAERAFLEELDVFQQNPGLLEKYLIGSEMSLAVLGLFLTRLFGSEGLLTVADAKEVVESVKDSLRVEEKSGRVCEKVVGRGDEHWAALEELKQQVLDLTRQFSALQRQLQMQGEVSQVAASLEGRLDEVASECEHRVTNTDEVLRAEIRRVDVGVSDVARDLEDLKKELGLRVRDDDLQKLAEEVSRLKEVEQRLREEAQLKIERFDVKSDPLDGIIAHLTRKCGGNVHEKGIVTVTASSCLGDGAKPENAVDLKSDLYFCSKDLPNSWICYDFGGRRVTPTSYSIRSFDGESGQPHPKSWVLEVSNDGSEDSWVVIDRRENNFDLNHSLVTRNFEISAPPSGAFRLVRLHQTGENHWGHDKLVTSGFELFGALAIE